MGRPRALVPLLVLLAACFATRQAGAVRMVAPFVQNSTRYSLVATSRASALYRMNVTGGAAAGQAYATAPYVLDLHGTHFEIGYDYAALMHEQTAETLVLFLSSLFPSVEDQELVCKFADFVWDTWLAPHTPQRFLDELDGMKAYYAAHGGAGAGAAPGNVSLHNVTADVVARRFYALVNLPAATSNIIASLEQEFEQGWPAWLKDVVNDLIKLLEKLLHTCDAYGVWGSRTQDRLLYSSRNVDYHSDTGINRFKTVEVYHIDDPKYGGVPPGGVYASVGFAFGLGALAGMSQAGITTSEMNLNNDVVTFTGVPFPLRLRYVMEEATDLRSAMAVWNATNNTNSFNFLIGSAADALRLKDNPGTPGDGAYALETIAGFTAQFGANSTIERDATYLCKPHHCHSWTNQTGVVHIGEPLPEAVWRSNHGLHPRIMATQAHLDNSTVFRYDLMHDLFVNLAAEGTAIDDMTAVGIVSTLGIKGDDFFTCDQTFDGDNVMSIAYAPGPRATAGDVGHMYLAWESGSQATWRPAACSPYIRFDMADWISQ